MIFLCFNCQALWVIADEKIMILPLKVSTIYLYIYIYEYIAYRKTGFLNNLYYITGSFMSNISCSQSSDALQTARNTSRLKYSYWINSFHFYFYFCLLSLNLSLCLHLDIISFLLFRLAKVGLKII